MINKENLLGLLGLSSRAGKVISGTDACIEYINKNKIKLMILAKDASDRTKLKFNQIAESKKIPIYEFGSIDEISKSIGKKNKAIIGITDINFSKEIIKRFDGGDVIG
ncbi:MAG TPA: ribosomal L7Ae/L30e/S12e/Gadd45 family protein [Clostridiaceae bacterium]|nr:putative ribosomal protein L7A family [Clostridium sp. CAG:571]HJJ06949.1 ribosomal L7Ae/L30e/S12e/Gadd45 family protein [Clostridiaceae bacterium]HJJ13541.1 ribosomal L7Ae/L30e/S12e/Gadd45 family protein [Clostridiaceae bacterium]